ncbi:MAG: hypothetical protein PHE56_08795 [Bacteroidales bacterium]|nr:hypothetical protein [Bacteroidales bacterium]
MIEIPARITTFIKEHHVLTLATCVGDESWCCNCFYTFIEDEAALLFTSDSDTKHIEMGLRNSNVSGSIVLETKIVGKIRGIQFTGELIKVENSEHSKYRLKYLKKFPFAIIINTDLWIIKLSKIKMTDNRLGFGKKLYWED